MLCRKCGHEKSKVIRTSAYGVLTVRYRECLKCKHVFQTGEEQFGEVESTLDMCKVDKESKKVAAKIRQETQPAMPEPQKGYKEKKKMKNNENQLELFFIV